MTRTGENLGDGVERVARGAGGEDLSREDAALSVRLDALGDALVTRELGAAEPAPMAFLEEARTVRAARWSLRAVGAGLAMAAAVTLAVVLVRPGQTTRTPAAGGDPSERWTAEGASMFELRARALETGEVPEERAWGAGDGDAMVAAGGSRPEFGGEMGGATEGTLGSLMVVPHAGSPLVGEVVGEALGGAGVGSGGAGPR
jgi:hypothetical protein